MGSGGGECGNNDLKKIQAIVVLARAGSSLLNVSIGTPNSCL